MGELKRIILATFLLASVLMGLKTVKELNKDYTLGSDIATQTYYTNQLLGDWGWGFVCNFGYRVKVDLTEYEKNIPTTIKKENYNLWWYVDNPTSATLARTEKYSVSLGAKTSSEIGASDGVLKAEIKAEVSSTYTYEDTLTVNVPKYSSISVYTFTVLNKTSYLKEKLQKQMRLSFWHVNVGQSKTVYGVSKTYKSAGAEIIYN